MKPTVYRIALKVNTESKVERNICKFERNVRNFKLFGLFNKFDMSEFNSILMFKWLFNRIDSNIKFLCWARIYYVLKSI